MTTIKFQLFEILKNSLKKLKIKSQKKIRKNSQKKWMQMESIWNFNQSHQLSLTPTDHPWVHVEEEVFTRATLAKDQLASRSLKNLYKRAEILTWKLSIPVETLKLSIAHQVTYAGKKVGIMRESKQQ